MNRKKLLRRIEHAGRLKVKWWLTRVTGETIKDARQSLNDFVFGPDQLVQAPQENNTQWPSGHAKTLDTSSSSD